MKAILLALCLLSAGAAPAVAAADCEGLKNSRIEFTTIDSAEDQTPPTKLTTSTFTGSMDLSIDRAFCRVRGTIRPSPTSNIRFEIWLPAADWNGRYLQVGNEGLAGFIPRQPLAKAIEAGYAAGGTDDGTTGASDLSWQSDSERQRDYLSRAVHLTAVAGQQLVQDYYGRKAGRSYFVGGSKGGQEALEEVQKFPKDFDGVVASFPAIRGLNLVTTLFWAGQQMNRSPDAMLRPPQLELLHKAVLKACAGTDGGLATDTFLTDPLACRFDPARLQCKAPQRVNKPRQAADCLTAEQVRTAQAIYRGPSNPRTGANVGAALPRGSEWPSRGIGHGWTDFDGATIKRLALEPNIGKTLGRENWDYRTFDFDRDVSRLVQIERSQSPDSRPDVQAFADKGGKLILIHGWNDTAVPVSNSIGFYSEMVQAQKARHGGADDALALEATRGFARMFLIPGYGHGESSGLTPVDPLPTIVDWVEKGRAPEMLPSVQYQDGDPAKSVLMKRDICLWPGRPAVDGSGRTSCQ
jgi:feruloyl esterase